MDKKTKISFYVSWIVTSVIVTALTIVFRGDVNELPDEVLSIIFTFLWIFLPFAILPSVAALRRRAIVTVALVTALFWTSVLMIANSAENDVNFGLIFVLLLSPALVVMTVLYCRAISWLEVQVKTGTLISAEVSSRWKDCRTQ